MPKNRIVFHHIWPFFINEIIAVFLQILQTVAKTHFITLIFHHIFHHLLFPAGPDNFGSGFDFLARRCISPMNLQKTMLQHRMSCRGLSPPSPIKHCEATNLDPKSNVHAARVMCMLSDIKSHCASRATACEWRPSCAPHLRCP